MGNPFVQPHTPITVSPASSHTGVNNSQPSVTGAFVIDGTPVRVAALGLAAGAVIFALRKSGFKFNVGVA